MRRRSAGAPAKLNATATLKAPARSLTIASLDAEWKQQPVHLLAPVRIDFANGMTIDHLRVGLHQAVLALQGPAAPDAGPDRQPAQRAGQPGEPGGTVAGGERHDLGRCTR